MTSEPDQGGSGTLTWTGAKRAMRDALITGIGLGVIHIIDEMTNWAASVNDEEYALVASTVVLGLSLLRRLVTRYETTRETPRETRDLP